MYHKLNILTIHKLNILTIHILNQTNSNNVK